MNRERLLQLADVLDKTTDDLHGPQGAWIWPKSREAMRGAKAVREAYKVFLNSHITIIYRSVARELRRMAEEAPE